MVVPAVDISEFPVPGPQFVSALPASRLKGFAVWMFAE
jgi:hypothetical protein